MYTGFTRHCLERMTMRNISEKDIAFVLAHGFFRNQPQNEVYKVEYGNLVVVVGYDCRLVTTFKIVPADKNSGCSYISEAKGRVFRRKREALKIAEFNREIKYA